ncbi:MAG: methyltransferase domain-containing protein, partial [Pseudomonadota bacterium]
MPEAPKAPKADDAPPPLFDVKARRRALARSRGAFGDCSFLHARILEDVHDRLRSVNRSFATAAFFGRWPEGGPAELSAALKLQTTMDFSDGAATAPAFEGQLAAIAEEEWCPLAPASVDLIVSLMSLHAANDPPGALAQLRRALKPDGLLIVAALGGESLAPLRSAFLVAETDMRGAAAPRVAPMADARAYGGLLQRAGFSLPVTDVDRVVVRYADGLSLLRDLKAMGETNVLSERSRTM